MHGVYCFALNVRYVDIDNHCCCLTCVSYLPCLSCAARGRYGVMVYHDLMYNGDSGAHSPLASATQDAELRHQIRRLSRHPSIVLWDSCNECVVTPNTTSIVYANFVMTVVAQEDQSRAVWPSSPGPGWLTGVNRLYVTPNDSPTGLTVHGGGHIWNQGIETHGPYVSPPPFCNLPLDMFRNALSCCTRFSRCVCSPAAIL
jgi:hypothetical protein